MARTPANRGNNKAVVATMKTGADIATMKLMWSNNPRAFVPKSVILLTLPITGIWKASLSFEGTENVSSS